MYSKIYFTKKLLFCAFYMKAQAGSKRAGGQPLGAVRWDSAKGRSMVVKGKEEAT